MKLGSKIYNWFVKHSIKFDLLFDFLGRSCLVATVIYTYQYVPSGFLKSDIVSPILSKLFMLIWNLYPAIKLMNILFPMRKNL